MLIHRKEKFSAPWLLSSPPPRFSSFAYLCEEVMSQFFFYLSIITSEILYLRDCTVCLSGEFCFVKVSLQ